MIKYELIRRKRRTVSILVSNGAVRVIAPMRMARSIIDNFVNEKSNWINLKLTQQAQRLNKLNDIIECKEVMLLSKSYPIICSNSVKKIKLTDSELLCPQKYFALEDKEKLVLKKAIKQWYKKQALVMLSKMLDEKSQNSGIKYSSFALSNARTKWGSCDNKQNIKLNWRLVILEEFLIEYVISHELAHIKIPNHSASFWQLTESLFSDSKVARKRLKEFSPITTFFR